MSYYHYNTYTNEPELAGGDDVEYAIEVRKAYTMAIELGEI